MKNIQASSLCSMFSKVFIIIIILFFIELIGVILVYKTTQTSSAQLNKTSSAHCIVHASSKAKSLSISIYPLCPPPPTPTPLSLWLSPLYLSVCLSTYLSIYPYHLYHNPLHSESYQSVPCNHASVSILFISLFCSLNSTYKWDQIAHLFLWLPYVT